MSTTKLVNQLLLGSIAFGISFILGLLAQRNLAKALLTGVITVPACYSAASVVNRRRRQQEKQTHYSLSSQIQLLERKETQLYQTLASAADIKQELEASIHALQVERNQLLHRVSELHCQRNGLYRELHTLQQQQQQQQQNVYSKQTQLQQLEKQKLELEQTLHLQTTQIRPVETRIRSLKSEFSQIEAQISERQAQKQQLDLSLASLVHQKQHLSAEIQELREAQKALEEIQHELKFTVSFLTHKKQELEDNLVATGQKREKVQQQMTEPSKTESLVEASNHLDRMPFLPKEWLEWLDFYQQLNQEDRSVLKAILTQDETTLKQIADQKATMTEVLIDSLNENAINTLGDTVFVRSSNSIIPDIYEEYSHILLKPKSVYFKDLLDKK